MKLFHRIWNDTIVPSLVTLIDLQGHFKVNQGHWRWHISVDIYHFVVCSNHVTILHRFWDIQHQMIVISWNLSYRLFKVIENGTILIDHTIIHTFLYVCNCKYSDSLYHFWVTARWKISRPWNLGYGSLKVIGNCTIWQIAYDFLLALYSDHGPICIVREILKVALEIWVRSHSV